MRQNQESYSFSPTQWLYLFYNLVAIAATLTTLMSYSSNESESSTTQDGAMAMGSYMFVSLLNVLMLLMRPAMRCFKPNVSNSETNREGSTSQLHLNLLLSGIVGVMQLIRFLKRQAVSSGLIQGIMYSTHPSQNLSFATGMWTATTINSLFCLWDRHHNREPAAAEGDNENQAAESPSHKIKQS